MSLLECLLASCLSTGPETPPEELPGIEFAEQPVEEPEAEPEPEPIDEPIDEPPEAFIEQPKVVDHGRSRPRAKIRQPIYGPLMITGGLIGGPNAFGFGAGVVRFVVPWIGVGLELEEIIVFDEPPFNDFALAGNLWILPTPYFRATPYIRGALGPEFFSSGLGIYGKWKGGAGVIVRFGETQRFAVRLGADVVGRIVDSRFEQHFNCVLTDVICSLGVEPEIGFAFALGQPR